jgi:phosphoglycolate phosphatase-like HAD superfamily hydrolase
VILPAAPRSYILDLDGTLMPSHEVDNRCYWQAVAAVMEQPLDCLELDGFAVVTDDGLLDEWCQRQYGRGPTAEQRDAVRARFLHLTQAAARATPGHFQPWPGTVDWLAGRLDEGSAIAIATGGWPHTAQFKLQVAGLERFALPLAASTPGATRTDIMATALDMLRSSGRAIAGQPVYIGDSPWDATAAAKLGWGFIGIAQGARADALRRHGASRVVEDFHALHESS